MPTGTLPASGKKLWEEVYDKALKGSCKGDESCAAGSAWKAVKNAGWRKVGGKWVKKAILSEFSLRIERASYDKATNTRRWRAVASDTDEDKRGDNMSLELFNDFIDRIKSNEPVPEEFRSDYWSGGMPYISISHYPHLDGKAVPGEIEATYIDGNRLKSKGTFNDTVLGRKCFEAINEDLYGTTKSDYDKVRMSIAFLDWKHQHKGNGFIFERQSIYDVCPECIREYMEDDQKGKIFLRGHLIHEALTRVPANGRTSMEVDKSMGRIATRKDDAASIIGDDEAEELEELQAEIGRSQVLVEFSDTMDDEEDECDDDDQDCKDKKAAKMAKKSEVEDEEVIEDEVETPPADDFRSMLSEFQNIMENRFANIEKLLTPAPPVSTPLDEPITDLVNTFSEVTKQEVSPDEKLRVIQQSYATLGERIIEIIRSQSAPELDKVQAEPIVDNTQLNQLADVVSALSQKFDLLLAKMTEASMPLSGPRVPERRSIQPQPFNPMQNQSGVMNPGQPIKIGDFARRSVGLE